MASGDNAPEEGLRPITDNERETLKMLSHGYTQTEIGTALQVSHSTVHGYVTRLLRHYEAESSAHAVAKAIRRGDLK